MKLRDESEACVVKRCLSCENADYPLISRQLGGFRAVSWKSTWRGNRESGILLHFWNISNYTNESNVNRDYRGFFTCARTIFARAATTSKREKRSLSHSNMLRENLVDVNILDDRERHYVSQFVPTILPWNCKTFPEFAEMREYSQCSP